MKLIYKFLMFIFIVFLLVCAVLSIYSIICIKQLNKSLLKGDSLLLNFDKKLCFYDDENAILTNSFSNGKEIATLNSLPNHVKYAFISIEDKNFYKHHGINLKRILKSIFDNITSGYAKSGASTISQQLIKNLHLSSSKTLKRKIQEAYLTKKLEKNYSKDEILETYLNVIYFGNNTYGIESASKKYFNCEAKNLTIEQAATLAGIIKSPSLYSPTDNPSACLKRRNLVLSEMEKDGFILKDEYVNAISTPLNLNIQKTVLDNSFYYKECIKSAENILGLTEQEIALSGYKIYTYLNTKTQNDAISSTKFSTNSLNGKSYCSIILDNNTLGVKAYVTNTAQTKRQPGSLIKPILCYAPALEEGILSPLTPIDDSPLNFPDWSPQNVDGSFEGYISTRKALYNSKNIPAIKTLLYVGIEKAKNYAQKMGLTFDVSDNHLALALGAMRYGITPIEVSACYACFSNMGEYQNAHFIRKIEDYAGRVVFEEQHEKEKVLSDETSFLVNDILHECSTIGTAKKLKDCGVKLCAKTGTVGNEQTNTDAWCVSYNKDLTILCWVGNTTGKPENDLYLSQNGGTIGAEMCLNLWQNNKEKNSWFQEPDGISLVCVDKIDYDEKHILTLASFKTPKEYVLIDYFNQKFVPTQKSTNFDDFTVPIINLFLTNDGYLLTFDEHKNLTYSLFINDKKIQNNIHTNLKLNLKEDDKIFITATHNFTKETKQSNVILVLKT